MDTEFDIRGLVRCLGSQGAKAGLMESKLWTVEALKSVATGLGVKFPDKAIRKDMIEELVRVGTSEFKSRLKSSTLWILSN